MPRILNATLGLIDFVKCAQMMAQQIGVGGKRAYCLSYSNSGSVAQLLTVFNLIHARWGDRGPSDGNDMMVVELQIIFRGCHGDVRVLSGC